MALPLDISASLATHLKTTDHTRGDQLQWFFRPKFGAFFTKDLKIVNPITSKVLQPNIQYRVLDYEEDAAFLSGKEVGTTIVILDSSVTTIQFTRRVVGGRFETVGSDVDEIITDQDLNDLNSSTWGQVIGKPKQFPPDPTHKHYTSDTYAWEQITYLIDMITNMQAGGGDNGLGVVYQYIDQVVSNARAAIDKRLTDLEEEFLVVKDSNKLGVGTILMSTKGTNPGIALKYGTWRRLNNTLLYGVQNDSDLGKLKKVGEGPSYLMTGVAFWELVSI